MFAVLQAKVRRSMAQLLLLLRTKDRRLLSQYPVLVVSLVRLLIASLYSNLRA